MDGCTQFIVYRVLKRKKYRFSLMGIQRNHNWQKKNLVEGKYSKDNHNALYVGILGDPEPKYVAAVIVRNPKNKEGSGGLHAAPIFGEFMQHSMRILNDISYANNRQ